MLFFNEIETEKKGFRKMKALPLKVDFETELEVAMEKIKDFIETIPTGKQVLAINWHCLVTENDWDDMKKAQGSKRRLRFSRASLPRWFKYHFGLTGQRITIECKLRDAMNMIDVNSLEYQPESAEAEFQAVGIRK